MTSTNNSCDPSKANGGAPLTGGVVFNLYDQTGGSWIGYNPYCQQDGNLYENTLCYSSTQQQANFWVTIPAGQYVQINQPYSLTTTQTSGCCPNSSYSNLGVMGNSFNGATNICSVYDASQGCSSVPCGYCNAATFTFVQNPSDIVYMSGIQVVNARAPVYLTVTSPTMNNGQPMWVGADSNGLLSGVTPVQSGSTSIPAGAHAYGISGNFPAQCTGTQSCCATSSSCIAAGSPCTTPPTDNGGGPIVSFIGSHELLFAVLFVLLALIAIGVAGFLYNKKSL